MSRLGWSVGVAAASAALVVGTGTAAGKPAQPPSGNAIAADFAETASLTSFFGLRDGPATPSGGVPSPRARGGETIKVTNTKDAGSGSLRKALSAAADGDTVSIAAKGTVKLRSKLPEITTSIRLEGPGAKKFAVSRHPDAKRFGILSTAQDTEVFISAITITGGALKTSAANPNRVGAGIFSRGTTTLNRVVVSGNRIAAPTNTLIPAVGAGIAAEGNLAGIRSRIVDNTATGAASGGGGILHGFGEMIVRESTIAGNRAAGGAAILVGGGGVADIERSTVSGNSGADAIQSHLVFLNVNNSTVAENSAAGISASGRDAGGGLTLRNSTIARNGVAGAQFNIALLDEGGFFPLLVYGRTIIADPNGSGENCTYNGVGSCETQPIQVADSAGHNIFDDLSLGPPVSTDLPDEDPDLKPLEKNGGPTQTMALRPNSPAIDAAANPDGFATDQRGEPRTFDFPGIPNAADGNGTDIGAFELR